MPRMPQLRLRALAFLSAILIAAGLAIPGLWNAGAQATLSAPAALPGNAANGAAGGRQEQPQIAKGADTSLAVWADARTVLGEGFVDIDNPAAGLGLGSLHDIYAARLGAAGQILDVTPLVVSQAEWGQVRPRVGWNGQNWLVTWFTKRPRDQFSHTYDIVAARVSPAGQVLDATPIMLKADLQHGMWPETVISDAVGNWVVVWTDFLPQEGSSIPRGVIVSRVANDGTVLDPGGRVAYNHHSQFMSFPDMARAGDLYMLTFEGYVGTTDALWALPLDANFNPLRPGPERIPGGGRARVASNGDTFFAVSGGLGTRISRDGDPLDPTGITISASAGGADAAQVTWDGANWLVSYNVNNPNGDDIAAARVSPAGAVLGSVSLDTGAGVQTYSGIAAVAGGGAQVVWADLATDEINTARVTAAGAASAETTLSRGAPRQTRPRLAPNGNGFLAVFRSEAGNLGRIMGQHLDAAGAAVDQEPFVIAEGAGVASPSVAWDGSEYLAVWEGPGAGGARQTFARVVPSAGAPAAPAFLVMNGTSPDVAGLNGAFVVVNILQETAQIRTTRAVRVSGAGAVVGTPVSIERLFNSAPRVAAFGSRWLAVWERHTNHDDAPGTIAGSFISPADGTATAPFVVGDAGNDRVPHLAVSGTQALVAWSYGDFAGRSGDINTRRLNADGTSPEPLAGSPLAAAADVQAAPAVAWDGNQYVVTWIDHRNAPFPRQARGDIYAARVSASNVRLEELVIADTAAPEETPFVASANGLTLFAYSRFYSAAPYAAHRITLRGARFNAPELGLGPAAPSVLVAQQVNSGPGTGSAKLTWRDNSTNETGFKVEGGANGTTYTQIRQLPAGSTTTQDIGVGVQTPNYFRVRAYNAAGDSDYSNVASAPAASIVSPADGGVYDAPATVPLVVAAADPDGVARVEFYASSDPLNGGPAGAPVLVGSDATPDAQGRYQFDWVAPAGYYHVTAKALDTQGSSTVTYQTTVFMRRGPSATLTAPANNATYTQPAAVALSATAQTNNGRPDESIQRLDFYAGDVWVGQGTATAGGGPWSFSWANAPAGTHSLTAHATSNWGQVGISPAVRVTVNPQTAPTPDTNARPTVTLDAPSNNTSVAAGATVSVAATAADADGDIVRVEFRADGFLVESDTTAPYGADLSLPGGAHSITAVAVDDRGGATTSNAASVNVARTAGAQLVSSGYDNQSNFGPSVVSRAGAPVSKELADDFDIVGDIDRVAVYGTRGFNPPESPRILGAYVRFYAWNNGNPGAKQEEMFLAAGDPGLVYDARAASLFDIRLPRSFRASGKHFFSVQLVVDNYNGYWYWQSARTGAPLGSAVRTRDQYAGGQWTAVSDATGVKNCDAVFTLYGTQTGAPRVDSLSQTTVARSGQLRISGANFGAAQGSGRVTVGGAAAIVARWSASQITVYVPEAAPLGATTVQVLAGTGSSSAPVTVTTRPADGRIKWRFTMAADYTLHRPGIAADGTVYVSDVAGRLYALAPNGALKWIFQAGSGGSVGPVTVGADGTVYVGGWTERDPAQQCPIANPVNVHGVFAVNPNGTLKWLFNRTCDTLEVGPNVGPDGKIYGVTDIGGIGTFALTPAGQLAFSAGRFSNRGGLGSEVVFGPAGPGLAPTQYYFQTDQAALEPQGELSGYTLAGQKVFEAVTVTRGQPAVGPASGNVYSVTFPVGAGTRLRSYTPQGALRWQAPISPTSGMSAPDAAPDETVYVTVDGSVLYAVDPATGATRWSYDDPHIIDGPVVSPDNRVLVLGGRITYGQPGFVAGVGTDGRLLWKQHLPDEPGFNEYGQVVPSSRARFTADGQTAYIAADVLGDGSTGGPPVYSYFYALDTSADAGPVNEPPAVSMTSPIAGSNVARRTPVTISANVTDDGALSGVDFYVTPPGGAEQLVSTDTTAPYSATYTPTAVGGHSIRVRARDAGGLHADATSNFHVPNELPRPVWTSPANNATFAEGTSITLKARATDPDGTVAKVEFFSSQGGLEGSDTTPDAAGDYSFTFTAPAVGTHELYAWATDNDGARGAATINVTVTSSAPPPTPTPTPTPDPTAPNVRITSPASGGSYALSTPVTFTAAATPTAGRTIQRVEFIWGPSAGGQVFCTDFNAPYNCTISDSQTRLYDILAVAYDSAGVAGKSIPTRVVFEDARKVSISGRLRHTASQPGNEVYLTNALVRLSMDNQPYREARTDSLGGFSFPELAWGGRYSLVPAEPGYTFAPPAVNYEGLVQDQVHDFVAEGPLPPQPAPAPTPGANVLAWEKFYNGPEGQSDGASALFVDPQGNTYVAGSTAGAGGDRDIVTMKYDASGARLWVKVFNGLGMADDEPADIRVDADGNVYVAGTSWRGAVYWQDFVTIKYDASGAEQWARYYNGPKGDTDMAKAIELDAGGNVYVAGYVTSAEPSTGHFFWEFATVKYDPSGAELWARLYSTQKYPEGHIATDIAVDSQGNSYVTGTAWLGASGGDSSKDVVTVKYSPAGAVLWTSRFNGGGATAESPDEAGGVRLDPSGNVLVFGNTGGGQTQGDFLLFKLNGATGALVWNRTWAAPFRDYAKDMAVDAAGNAVIVGETFDADYYTATDYPTSDVATVKFSGAGALLWDRVYRAFPGKQDGGRRVALDSAGAAYVGAYSEGFFNSDTAVIKYGADGAEAWVYRYDNPSHTTDQLGAMRADPAGNLYLVGTSLIRTAPGVESFDITAAKLAVSPTTVLNAPPDVSMSVGGAPTAAAASLSGGGTGAPNALTVSGCTATFSASAADRDGAVSKVDFYNGPTLVGTDASAPYSLNWTAPAAGSYAITAMATDNRGATRTTAAAAVTFGCGGTPPPAPAAYSLTGQVTSAGGGALGGVTVTLSGSQSATATTGPDGRYTFSGIPAGSNCTVTPAFAGYQFTPASKSFTGVASNQTADFAAAERINYALAANGATASSSSAIDAGRSAAGTINGDRKGLNWGSGGGWHDATKDAFPDWLEVTFGGGAKTIGEVSLFTVQDAFSAPATPTAQMTFTKYGVTGYEVRYWDLAAGVWKMVPNGIISGNDKVWRKITFAPLVTTKIRVVTTNALAGHSRLAEVEAWGSEPPSANTPTPLVNHALAANGATAAASSTLDAGRSAPAVINGDRKGLHWGTGPATGSGWHDATKDAYPDWLEINFGGTRSVSEVNLFSVQDAYAAPAEPTAQMLFTKYGVTGFQVEYWTGTAWQLVPNGLVVSNSNVWARVTFAPVTTAKLRVVINGALAGHARVTEVEAWGPPPAEARVNHALAAGGATATASSTLDAGRSAAAVINGDRRGIHWGSDPSTGSGWHDATANAFPDWVEVNLGGTKSVSEVHVFSVQDNLSAPQEPTDATAFTKYGVRDFDVQYWTGTAWQVVPGGMVTGNTKVWRKVTFAPLNTSKLRVVVRNALAGHSRLAEIEVY